MQYLCFCLVSLGGILMIITTVKYSRLIAFSSAQNLPKYIGALRVALQLMMLFFITGFVVGAVHLLQKDINPVFYFVSIVFFIASIFSLLLVHHLVVLARAYNQKNDQLSEVMEEIADHNRALQGEVDTRVQTLLYQDSLLRTVNDVAATLLASDTDSFDRVLWQCMGRMAGAVDVDRMYIWKNYSKDGILYCTQVYEWSEGVQPMQGTPATTDIPYSQNIPGWKEILADNMSISGLVQHMTPAEQTHLAAQGIVSILVVPVFMRGEFWGFVGFDDCRKERSFSEAEEAILRSASLLVATAMLRNEMTLSIIESRELAKSSTRAKSDFLANMSHEIRTPINAITGMTALARKSGDIPQIHAHLDKIDAASRQLLGLINDILDMSKIEAGKMELAHKAFCLPTAIQNVRSIMGIQAAAKNQHLAFTLADDIPQVVVGDDMRVSQILINLLSNAVKFTPENGHITVDIGLADVADGAYQLQMRVCDDGIGMTQEQQSRLFRAFEQADRNTARQFGGTGLGLSISANIAALMRGDISVESQPGVGSCFTVRIWLQGGDEAMLAGRHLSYGGAEERFTGKVALLADDITINQEIVVALLADWGMSCDCAQDGEEALRMFTAAPERYDIIFMDVHMPVMDGYEATGHIRAVGHPRAQTVPIIAMTANAFSEDVQRCLDAGMNAHIAKPLDIDQLHHVISQHVLPQ